MTEDDTVGVEVAVEQGEGVGWRGEEEEERVGGAGDPVPPSPDAVKSTEGVEVRERGPVGDALFDPPPAPELVACMVAVEHIDTLTVVVMEREFEDVPPPPPAKPREGEEEAVNVKAAVPVVVAQEEGD